MKKIATVLTLTFIIAGSLTISAQTPYGDQFNNPGYEEWANYNPVFSSSWEPLNWHSFMSMSGSGIYYYLLQAQQINDIAAVRPGSNGTKSARVYPRAVSSYVIPGIITNGRINISGTELQSSDNYICSLISNPDFCTPLSELPDSITLWYSFRCNTSDQVAAFSAIVHGDGELRIAMDMTVNNPELVVASGAGFMPVTTTVGSTDYNWQRVTVPIVFSGPCEDPRYILFGAITTTSFNSSTSNEDLILDDVLLVYNPTLTTGQLDNTNLYFDENVTQISFPLPFELSGTMSPSNLNLNPNEVIAQLSDASGNFDNPIELGRIISDESDTVPCIVNLEDVEEGIGYRIRVVSTNYPVVAEDNGQDISVDFYNNGVFQSKNIEVEIYPNPTKNYINISSLTPFSKVVLFSMSGQLVKSFSFSPLNTCSINVANLDNGIYLLKIDTERKPTVCMISVEK